MTSAVLLKGLGIVRQLLYRRLSYDVRTHTNIVFRARSMYDYHEDESALNNLLRCNGVKDRVQLSTINGCKVSGNFYVEYIDSLWYMHPYPESYCFYLIDAPAGRVVAMNVINLKRVYFGAYLMAVGFERLMRVDVNRRRQGLAISLHRHVVNWLQFVAPDYTQNYTLLDNTISLNMQRSRADEHKTLCHLDLYLVPTTSDTTRTRLHKLTAEETERLCMVDMVDWINRPILTDLRRILQMKEYRGTFCAGDLRSGRYAAASLWKLSTGVICHDYLEEQKTYRGPIYYVFNLFQPSHVTSKSNDEMQMLLSAIRSMVANQGVPFVLCCVEQPSPFNALCRQQAIATTTLVMLQCVVSSRSKVVEDVFRKSPVWHDPRDLS